MIDEELGSIMARARTPDDPEELALVVRALLSGLSDCVEWRDDSLVKRVRDDPEMGRLRPQFIRLDLIQAVREDVAIVVQVPEIRPEYQADRPYYYKVILHYDEIPNDVFVEMILNDPDPAYPAVTIVSVHPQRRI